MCIRDRPGRFVLTMGGDHSIALGTVAAACAARPDTRVLWVDAHADANSPGTSPSGNMHGMPLAFLLGLVEAESLDEDATYFDWLLEKPFLSPERLAYVGLRDVDDDERCALRGLAARGTYVSSMHDVDKYGIGRVVDEALAHLGYDGTDEVPAPLHLSFDVDACDPLIAPATGTAVRGGLSFREAHFVCAAAAISSPCPRRPAGTFTSSFSFCSSLRASVIGVSIKPGAITFTVIPRLATSAASDLLKPIIPAFDAA